MAQLETSENAKEEVLQTHYYKASYTEIKNCYLDFIKSKKAKLNSVNDDYCEIFSEGSGLVVTAKIIMQNPKETSIDFYIASDSILGAVKGKKYIKNTLDYIGSKFELKGVSLHK